MQLNNLSTILSKVALHLQTNKQEPTSIKLEAGSFIIVFRMVRDVVANHKTTRYAGAATKVIQKNHLA